MLCRQHARVRPSLLALAILALSAVPAGAQNPGAPRTWETLRKSELVIGARYHSHKGDMLSLEVLDVLRGNCKVGDVLSVKLGKALTIGVNSPPENPNPHLQERDASFQLIPPVHFLESPLIYFLSKQAAPRLEQVLQIQAYRRDGWKQALAGAPTSLSFRLTLEAHLPLYKEALAELYVTRDAVAISGLLPLVLASDNRATVAERILRTLGDHKGDLYEPTLKAIKEFRRGNFQDDWLLTRLTWLLARADSKRAYHAFAAILKEKSPAELRRAVVMALPDLESVEGLELLFAQFQQAELSERAFDSLTRLMYPSVSYPSRNDKILPSAAWAKLQDLAVARIQKAFKKGEFPDQVRQRALWQENFHSLVHEVNVNQYFNYYPPMSGNEGPPLRVLPPRFDLMGQETDDEVERALRIDIVVGRKKLEAALASKEELAPDVKAHRLWLAAVYGDPDRHPQGKQPVRPLVRFRTGQAPPLLQREPLSTYLKNPQADVLALYPNHLDEYFKRVAILIVSENSGERNRGFYGLEDRFAWKFDLDPTDPPPALARKLAELRPLFTRMGQGSLLEARGVLLNHFGIKLDGPPSKRWLPALERAACSWNPTICLNALRVLCMLTGDPGRLRYATVPLSKRAAELRSHMISGWIYNAENLGRWDEKPLPLDPAFAQTTWQNLSSDDAETGLRTMQMLVKSPASTQLFLRQKLTVPATLDAKRCAPLIADLDSPVFKVREKANAELKKLGEGVTPYLRRELEKPVPLEVRRRLEELLRFHVPGRVALVRALQVLENLPGTRAWDFLEELAAGPADASLTREAQAALRRVKQYWQW